MLPIIILVCENPESQRSHPKYWGCLGYLPFSPNCSLAMATVTLNLRGQESYANKVDVSTCYCVAIPTRLNTVMAILYQNCCDKPYEIIRMINNLCRRIREVHSAHNAFTGKKQQHILRWLITNDVLFIVHLTIDWTLDT